MMRNLLILLCCIPLFSQAQLIPINQSIPVSQLHKYLSGPNTSFKKGPGNAKNCGVDTLRYGYYKGFSGQAYRPLGVSNGFAVGQYYDAPTEVEISGVTFFAYGVFNTDDSVQLIVNIYAAGSDTLPAGGSPIRSTTIYIDSFTGTPSFDRLEQIVTFSTPFTTTDPFIITIESVDSLVVGVVANDWLSNVGLGENLACATVGGTWYNCLNLNVGGNILDCDFLIEPHVKYSVYADFEVDNCYDFNDTVRFKNTSNPVIDHRMYNRLYYNNLTRFSFDWKVAGNTYVFNSTDLNYKYPQADNHEVSLYTETYRYTSYTPCRDTATKMLYYQPTEVEEFLKKPVCVGDPAEVIGVSNAEISWYSSFIDTQVLYKGPVYTSDTLYNPKLIFNQAHNGLCSSLKNGYFIPVNKRPSLIQGFDDSVCLNAKANLRAVADVGNIMWWSDSVLGVSLFMGEIYTTMPLDTTTLFYVDADNKGCKSNFRIPVEANINPSNAPAEPTIMQDTVICFVDGEITLRAESQSGDSIKWFGVAGGGSLLNTGNSLSFTADSLGKYTFYAEADDGQCQSTRLGTSVTVMSFPEISIDFKDTLCLGDTSFINYSQGDGSIRWFDAITGGNLIYDDAEVAVSGLTVSTTFYLEPYLLSCKDTARHPVTIDIIPFGILTEIKGQEICEDEIATLSAKVDYGEIYWSEFPGMNPIIATGNSFTTPSLGFSKEYYIQSRNYTCFSNSLPVQVEVNKRPNAGFNYQVSNPGEFNFQAVATNVTYKWELGDGTTSTNKNLSHQYTHNNEFWVQLITTAANGCSDTFRRKLTVTGLMTGVESYGINGLEIYPNPNNGQFTVENPDQEAVMHIFNCQGQATNIVSLKPGRNAVDLSLSSLQPGIYTILISWGDKHAFHRVLIQ